MPYLRQDAILPLERCEVILAIQLRQADGERVDDERVYGRVAFNPILLAHGGLGGHQCLPGNALAGLRGTDHHVAVAGTKGGECGVRVV